MLQPLGIGLAAERLYLALSPLGAVEVEELCQVTAIGETEVLRLLQELRDLGLATREQSGRWTGLPLIDVSKALMAQRQSEIEAAMRAAEALHGQMLAASDQHGEDVQTIVGREANVHLQRELCAMATTEICGFDRPPYVNETGVTTEQLMVDSPEFQALTRGVKVRSVYHPGFEADRLSILSVFMSHGEQARIGHVPLKLLLVDNRAAMIPSMSSYQPGHELTATLIRHPMIIEAFQWLFETVWTHSVSASTSTSTSSDKDPRREVLISLLMTGSTDTAIAGQFGVNERSVRRYVSDLMEEFGVSTRLQLGAALARPAVARPRPEP